MAGIFPDCAFPDDCECAKRGYQHELESCGVTRVREAAAMFGLDPELVVKPHRYRAIFIDAERREFREVEYAQGYRKPFALSHWLGSRAEGEEHAPIEAAYGWDNGDVLWVDEEGLLKPQRFYFRFSLRTDGFPLAGHAIVTGREVEEDDGESYHTEPPIITIDELKSLITFLTKEQVDAWAKGNASEPAGEFWGVGPGGVVEHGVTARVGELYGQAPPSRPEFSVYAFGPDGRYAPIVRFVDVGQAMAAVTRLVRHPNIIRRGDVRRVIITDGGDFTVFEWVHGKGVVWPKPPGEDTSSSG